MDPFPSEEIRLAFIAFFFPHPPLRSVHLFTQVERLPQFSIALRRVDGNLQFVEPQDPRFLFAFPPGRLHRNVLSRKEERREQDKPPTPQKKKSNRDAATAFHLVGLADAHRIIVVALAGLLETSDKMSKYGQFPCSSGPIRDKQL